MDDDNNDDEKLAGVDMHKNLFTVSERIQYPFTISKREKQRRGKSKDRIQHEHERVPTGS